MGGSYSVAMNRRRDKRSSAQIQCRVGADTR